MDRTKTDIKLLCVMFFTDFNIKRVLSFEVVSVYRVSFELSKVRGYSSVISEVFETKSLPR